MEKIISAGKKTIKLYTEEIMYAEVYGHELTIYGCNGAEEKKIRMSLDKFYELVGEKEFARIGQSVLVNMDKIKIKDANILYLENGVRLDIKRTYVKAFAEKFKCYYGIQNGEDLRFPK